MTHGIYLRLLGGLLLLIFLQSGQLLAQDWPPEEDAAQEPETISGRQPDGEISSQMPGYGRSLKDSIVQNSRNKAGVSFGLFGLYDKTDLGSNYQSDEDTSDMMISPSAFVNFGKRKALFHADYSMEHRLFSDVDDYTFHTGNLGFIYLPSRRWTLTATNDIRSAPSDLLSLTGGFSPGLPIDNPVGPGISGYSYERVLMNRAAGDIRYQINRKTFLSIYGNSQIFRYDSRTSSDTDAYNVGARFSRKLNRKLDASIGFMYGDYENVSGTHNDKIKRVSGGLGYQISNDWRIYGDAGVEWVDAPEDSYNPTFFSAAIGRTTDSSIFAISYTRAAQYQLGTSFLTGTDTISLSLDQRLTRKSSLMLGAYYYRSDPYDNTGLQNTFISGGGLRYAMLPNIMASVSGNYQYQDKAFRITDSPSLNRYIVYAGIEIIFPGLSRR